MQTVEHNLLTRPDTFFGVCEGLGQDLGVHPNLLRIAFAGSFFWSPYAAVAVYAALGALVALTRWLFPSPRAAAPAEVPVAVQAPVETEATAEAEPLAIAA